MFKFSTQSNNKLHHFGFWVDDIKKETQKMISNNYLLINKFKIKVPFFGGSMNTVFFYKEKKIIELITSDNE